MENYKGNIVNIDEQEINAFKPRRCFFKLCEFIDNKDNIYSNRVAALYGLRRTGKSVLMKQAYLRYGASQCEMLQYNEDNTMSDVYSDLDECIKRGKRIVFLDEITYIPNFIKRCEKLSDIYTNLRIVIAGTDSLSLVFAGDRKLFDRITSIPTTYISFAEFSEVKGIKNIDKYIKHGGLMDKGLNEASADTAKHYLDSAVSDNIVHSIKNAVGISCFSEIPIFSHSDLRTIINRLVEYYSGHFTVDEVNNTPDDPVITIPFKRFSLSYSDNLKDELAADYAKAINTDCTLERPATAELIKELDLALFMLDVLSDNDTRTIWLSDQTPKITGGEEEYIVQPAIKYSQLLKAKDIYRKKALNGEIRGCDLSKLSGNLTNTIFGQMTENIVLFDTDKALSSIRYEEDKRYWVTKPKFRVNGFAKGEYDMLIVDNLEKKYYAFEIKHADYINNETDANGIYRGQDRHLINDRYKNAVDRLFSCERNGAAVLYNGSPCISPSGTYYINTADFLITLDREKDVKRVIEELVSECRTNISNDEANR